MRIFKTHPLLSLINGYLVDSPQPSNISYLWNFASLLALFIVIQIVTGVTLAMHYNPSLIEAFNSVEHIMRDVNNGWLMRYLLANTASALIIFTYQYAYLSLYHTQCNKDSPLYDFKYVLGCHIFSRLAVSIVLVVLGLFQGIGFIAYLGVVLIHTDPISKLFILTLIDKLNLIRVLWFLTGMVLITLSLTGFLQEWFIYMNSSNSGGSGYPGGSNGTGGGNQPNVPNNGGNGNHFPYGHSSSNEDDYYYSDLRLSKRQISVFWYSFASASSILVSNLPDNDFLTFRQVIDSSPECFYASPKPSSILLSIAKDKGAEGFHMDRGAIYRFNGVLQCSPFYKSLVS